MTKAELISALAANSGLTKADAEIFLRALSDVVLNVIATEDSVRLGEIGTISGYTRPSRTGRNPSSGETIIIPEKPGYPKMKFSRSARA